MDESSFSEFVWLDLAIPITFVMNVSQVFYSYSLSLTLYSPSLDLSASNTSLSCFCHCRVL